jgi:hypothetical protein
VHCFGASRSTPELWQVSVLADDSLPEAVSNLSLDIVKPLWSVQRLSGLFEKTPSGDHVHSHSTSDKRCDWTLAVPSPQILRAIYHSPTDRQLCLNCWVLGDEVNRVFSVDISGTKNVSALKDAISERNPDLGPARTLELWKVSASITIDRNLEEHVLEIDIEHREPLSPVAKLFGAFPDPLVDKDLHVVIRAASGKKGEISFPE